MSTTLTDTSIDTRLGWRGFFVPSLADLLYLVIFVFTIILGSSLTSSDGDLGRHLLLGGIVLDTGSIPQVDVFSFTVTGTEIIPHWWLAQAAFAGVERWLGFDGIGLLTAVLAALPWFVMYRWLVTRGTPVAIAGSLGLLGSAATVIHLQSRPHMFTWVFVMICVLLLEDLRTGHRRQVWILVPLAVLWANTHAGFTIGVLVVGTYFVGSLLQSWLSKSNPTQQGVTRHLGMVLVGVTAGAMITPGGVATITNAFSYLGLDFLIDTTVEYQSPDFHNPLVWPFLGLLLVSVLLAHRWNATHVLLVVSWTASALYSSRNIPIYAIVVTPVLAASLASRAANTTMPNGRLKVRLQRYAKIERRVIGGFLALIITLSAGFLLLGTPGSAFELDRTVFPSDAMEEYGEHPPGERPFHMFNWGGYLEYCCHPEVLVFIDGQTDIYGEELSKEYLATVNGEPDWRRVFAEHGVDWVLIEPDVGLAQVLAESNEWTETYRDETAVVYVPASA